MVRENRKIFLSKKSFKSFKNYAFSQLKKMKTKEAEGKRKEIVEKYGYDTKFATHLVRLLNEIEQVMIEEDLDLERNREQLKSIRNGEWSLEQLESYFEFKERSLEDLYTKSNLPYSPNEKKVKELLLNCLEEYYGSLDSCIVTEPQTDSLIHEIEEVLRKYKK